jgi:hypothetical protein
MMDTGHGLSTQRHWSLQKGGLFTPGFLAEAKREPYEAPLCRFLGKELGCDIKLFVNPYSILDAYNPDGHCIVELKSVGESFEDLQQRSGGAWILQRKHNSLLECCTKITPRFERGLYCYLDKDEDVWIVDYNIVKQKQLPLRPADLRCDVPHYVVKIVWWTRVGRIS